MGRRGSWRGVTLLGLAAAGLLLGPCDAPRGGRAVPPGADEPGEAVARVTRVIDGDTIEVAMAGGASEDVRYIGVDTPETVKPDTPVQCFGPRAHAANQRLVGGRTVRLRFGTERRDKYGRLLAYVYLGRRFVNAILVRRGLARTLTIPPNDAFAPLLDRLQRAAGRAGRGLWGRCRA
jgi:micrococcal nuclease